MKNHGHKDTAENPPIPSGNPPSLGQRIVLWRDKPRHNAIASCGGAVSCRQVRKHGWTRNQRREGGMLGSAE